MRPRAIVLVLLLAGARDASAAVRGRLVPELALGGGFANDLFVGAGFGQHGQATVAPALGADLSTGPVVKLHGEYRFTHARYGTEAHSEVHEASARLRVRLGRQADLDLDVAAARLAHSDPLASAPGVPPTTSSRQLVAGPLVRLRASDRDRAEISYGFTARESDTGLGLVPEAAHHLCVSASHRVAPAFEAGLAWDHVANRAALDDLSYEGDGGRLFAALALPAEVVARPSVALHVNRFPVATVGERTDLYAVLGVSATRPIVDGLEAELASSWAANRSDDPLYEGQRLLVYAGVRGRWSWGF